MARAGLPRHGARRSARARARRSTVRNRPAAWPEARLRPRARRPARHASRSGPPVRHRDAASARKEHRPEQDARQECASRPSVPEQGQDRALLDLQVVAAPGRAARRVETLKQPLARQLTAYLVENRAFSTHARRRTVSRKHERRAREGAPSCAWPERQATLSVSCARSSSSACRCRRTRRCRRCGGGGGGGGGAALHEEPTPTSAQAFLTWQT
jgi:hypothetical protein